MSIARRIRAYINRLPIGEIFSTRDLLPLGARGAVDQTTCRLVQKNIIVRLASGLFQVFAPGIPMPTIADVAEAKAKAFSKTTFIHGKDAAFELKLTDTPNDKVIYYVSGSSTSSFESHIHNRKVHLKSTASRRLCEGDSRVGKTIRSLWELREEVDFDLVMKATMNLNRQEIEKLRMAAKCVPKWLSRFTNFAVSLRQP